MVRSKWRFSLAVLVSFLLVPVAAMAQVGGGGAASGVSSAASTSTVTLTIPGVVAIDVETSLVFNLNSYLGGPPLARAGAVQCVADKFPPAAGCTGGAIYSATSNVTDLSVPAPAPTGGDVWLSLFSNKSSSTITVTAEAGAWSSAPAVDPDHVQILVARGTNNTGNAIGEAVATPAVLTAGSGSPTALTGSVSAPFGWTRYDQNIRLRAQDGSGNASGVVFNEVTNVTSTVTFTANAS